MRLLDVRVETTTSWISSLRLSVIGPQVPLVELASEPPSELDEAVGVGGVPAQVHDRQVSRLNQYQLYFTWHVYLNVIIIDKRCGRELL